MKKTEQEGFTLIELLLVIAIVGILASVVLVKLSNSRERARNAQRKSDLRQLATAIEAYRAENGRYPMTGGWCTQISHPTYGPQLQSALATWIPRMSFDPIYRNTFQDYFYRRINDNQYYLYAEFEGEDKSDDGFTGCTRIGGTNNEYDYRFPPF